MQEGPVGPTRSNGFCFDILSLHSPGPRPMLSLAFASREEAEEARSVLKGVISKAIDVQKA